MKTRAQELGEAIEKDRAKTGASQEDIAKAVGVTQQAFSGWEAGASLPRNARLQKLREIFGSQSQTAHVVDLILPSRHNMARLPADDDHKSKKFRPAGAVNLDAVAGENELRHTAGAYFRRPKGAKPMGELSSDPGDKTPPMSTDEPLPRADQGQATYGIRSFEAPQENPNAGEMHDALTRAASGVQLARQVLDDAATQIARALNHSQRP